MVRYSLCSLRGTLSVKGERSPQCPTSTVHRKQAGSKKQVRTTEPQITAATAGAIIACSRKHPHRCCFSPGGGTEAADVSKLEKEASQEKADERVDRRSRNRRVPLGQEGWRVCLVTACLPVILPWRAREQHKNITQLYPVESTGTQKVGGRPYDILACLVPWLGLDGPSYWTVGLLTNQKSRTEN